MIKQTNFSKLTEFHLSSTVAIEFILDGWGNKVRLGRFLNKNTPKAGSRKRKGSPHTDNKKVAIFGSCIRRNELLVRLSDHDGCSRMILRWLENMKIPSWSGQLTRIIQVEGSDTL